LSNSQLAMPPHRKQPQLAKRRGTLTHRTHTQLTGKSFTPGASLLGRCLANPPLTSLCPSPTTSLHHRRAQNLLKHPFKAPTAGDALTAPPKHPNKLHHPCRFPPQAANALTRSQRCLASLSALLPDCPRCKHTAALLQRCRRCHDSDGAVPGLPTDCPQSAVAAVPKDAVTGGNASNGLLPDCLRTAYGLPTLGPPSRTLGKSMLSSPPLYWAWLPPERSLAYAPTLLGLVRHTHKQTTPLPTPPLVAPPQS
jgi:hypothetical protein